MKLLSTTTMPAPSARPATGRPIRVCYLIDGLARAGTESQLLALIRSLDRSRVEPFLCLLGGEDDESRALEPEECPVLRLGVRSLHRPSSAARAFQLARFLRARQIDLLQVYFPDSICFGIPVARLAGVRRVVRCRNNLGYSLTRAHRWIGRLYNPLIDATVTNCEAGRQAIVEGEGIPSASVTIIENGVDLARYPDRAPGDPTSRRVGMVANLRPVKEPETFLRAARIVASRHADVEFQIAGEGERRPALERQIDELALRGRCTLAGAVADVPGFLTSLDVAVLCSRSEGQSNALLEYMAAGRPIVATAVGGNRELIEPDVTGLLVPPGSPEALADAINQLLEDPARAAQLGAAARARVRECYSQEARARRFEAFYARLLAPSPNL